MIIELMCLKKITQTMLESPSRLYKKESIADGCTQNLEGFALRIRNIT